MPDVLEDRTECLPPEIRDELTECAQCGRPTARFYARRWHGDPCTTCGCLNDRRMLALDLHVLSLYWTSVLTEVARALLANREVPPPDRYALRMIASDLLLRDEAGLLHDFVFHAECIRAYTSLYDAPFFINVPELVIEYTIAEIAQHNRVPPFPTARPTYCTANALIPTYDTINEAEFSEAISDIPQTVVDKQVQACPHTTLGTRYPLMLREGLDHLDFLGVFRQDAPRCNACGAVIICKCVEEAARDHLGRTHAVLASGRLGFKEQMCPLCRPVDDQAIEDVGDLTVEVVLRAISRFAKESPDEYRALFDVIYYKHKYPVPRRDVDPLMDALHRILLGEPVRELRQALELTRPVIGPRERLEFYIECIANEERNRFGLPLCGEPGVQEALVFKMVSRMFKGRTILRNARPDWLVGLELDVFVPDERVAFEYMGEQHYHAIDFFGGQEKFERQVQNDSRKIQICRRYGIRLIHVHCFEEVTRSLLEAKLKQTGLQRWLPDAFRGEF